MSVNKSIIEDMELATGTQLYVQASGHNTDRISLSFDGSETTFGITLTVAEATKYQALINKVLEELNDGK